MLLLSLVTTSYPKGGDSSPATNEINQTIIDKLYSLDGFFIENIGQVADGIRYYSRGNPSVGFRDDGVVFVITEVGKEGRNEIGGWIDPMYLLNPTSQEQSATSAYAYMIRFKGSNKVTPVGTEEFSFKSNFLIGNDPEGWRTGVPEFRQVAYDNLYDGIDLVYRLGEDGVKYEFIVGPRADLDSIEISFEGVESLNLDSTGVTLHTVLGDVHDTSPISYQQSGGAIECTFVVRSRLSYGFECKGRDASKILVIDPLIYSTYLGGGDRDHGLSIAVDTTGNAYVAGTTWSADFPVTPGALDRSYNYDFDVFVSKLNHEGDGLAYSTFLGGRWQDVGQSIAVDSSGNVYVTGNTMSSDFPTTPGSFDTTLDGFMDVFVAKLNAAGNALVYSSLLGGSDGEDGLGIGLDGKGNAYVAGYTRSSDFPVTSGAFDRLYNGGYRDLFATKINADGSALLYSTFLGGSGDESGYSLAIDSTGEAYITGKTRSVDFPTSPGGFDRTLNSDSDAFVAKLSVNGSDLVYSTFLGGESSDIGLSITVDSANNAYVTGSTNSVHFPTTPFSFDTSYNGRNDAFVTKLNETGSVLLYSTYLGGTGEDNGYSIAVDAVSNAYVTGDTYLMGGFPVTPDAFDTTLNSSDIFVTKFNVTGGGLDYSTFLGGSKWEGWFTGFGASHLSLDSFGIAYVIGQTDSSDFPTTAGAFDVTFNGGLCDVFVTKLNVTAETSNDPPIVSSFIASSATEGAQTIFTVAASDPDGDALTYDFDFESDGVFDVSGPSNVVTHVYGDDFNGTATVRVSDGNLSTEATTQVIVLNVPPTINGEITATATFDLTLRVAGEKWHDVSAYLVDGGNETLKARLVREPGKPQEISFGTGIDVTRNNSLRIAYSPADDKVNGQPNGATPAWLNFTFDSGPPVKMHHTFNVRHPETWNWTVSLNSLLAGRNLTFTATATDPGSDDLTFTWDWGDGTPATTTTYYNDGIGPDPYPSPGGTFPYTATDTRAHAYTMAGTYSITLRVTDDDGGAKEIMLVIIIV